MDKKSFIKLINLIVNKKIEEVLPKMVEKEVEKYLSSGIEPTDSDFEIDDFESKPLLPYNTKQKNAVIRDNSIKEEKAWTKNPAINKILNETANSGNKKPLIHPTDELAYGSGFQKMIESEYDGIANEFTFNTKNMENAIQRTSPMPKKRAEAELKNQVIQSGAPPEIANAMIKDYSKLLKATDKIAKKTRNNSLPLNGSLGDE